MASSSSSSELEEQLLISFEHAGILVLIDVAARKTKNCYFKAIRQDMTWT